MFYNSYDISKARKKFVPSYERIIYVQSDRCKRELIMRYFEYDEYLKTWAVQLGIPSKLKISIGGSQG